MGSAYRLRGEKKFSVGGQSLSNNILDFLIAGSVGLIGWFFGGLDGFLKILIALSVIDYCSGLAVGYVERNLSSAIGFYGILKKCLIFSFVGIAHIIDSQMLGDTEALRTAVILFYIGNEGISIIENADKLHVPIPKFLHGRFLNFTKQEQDNKKNGQGD